MSKTKNSSSRKAGFLLIFGALFVGLIIVAAVAVLAFPNIFLNNLITSSDSASSESLMERNESEATQLNSYGWVDEASEQVRIPIEQAMALVAERGLPVGDKPVAETVAEAEVAPTEPPEVEAETEEPTPTPEPAAEEAPTATPAPESAAEPEAEATPTLEPTPTPEPAAEEAPTVDLASVSFQGHVLPIFEEHCLRCHGGEDTDGEVRLEEGLDLTSYETLIAGSWNGSVIEPGDVEDSYLIEQIATGRMPKEGPSVPQDQLEIISAWVESGALDN